MLPVKNVELTKVHYFEPAKNHRNVAIPTISHEVFQNTFNRNVIIKKNIFGHKWVLKINEFEDGSSKKKNNVKFWIYSVVCLCLLIAVLSGLFCALELEKKVLSSTSTMEEDFKNQSGSFRNYSREIYSSINQSGKRTIFPNPSSEPVLAITQEKIFQDKQNVSSNSSTLNKKLYCAHCTPEQVCLKTEETEKPKCLKIVDPYDPTGCGGNCLLNVEFCAMLDKTHKVYQCSPLRNILKCPQDTFNCGEQCIPKKKVCDGVIHCKEMQDEKNCDCNLEENFKCSNSMTCLPKSKICDGIIDCWDRSDETHCHQSTVSNKMTTGCSPEEYKCLNGQCIPREEFCDGIVHCADSSDEPKGCQL